MYEGIRNSKVENARKKMHSEVTSYKLSPEELAEYTKGDDRVKLTKEIYEAAKRKNMSDIAVTKEYRVHPYRLKELKAQWYPEVQKEEEGVVEELVKRDDLAAKKGLTKNEFVTRKENGEADTSIGKEFGLYPIDISRLRETWGLQGKKTKAFVEEAEVRKQKSAIPKSTKSLSEAMSGVGKALAESVKTSPITDVATVTLTEYKSLEAKFNELQESHDEIFNLNNELKEMELDFDKLVKNHEKLQEDYDALSEEADKLTSDLKGAIADNKQVWSRNKELQEENNALKESPSVQVEPTTKVNISYEELYQVTAQALVAHIQR